MHFAKIVNSGGLCNRTFKEADYPPWNKGKLVPKFLQCTFSFTADTIFASCVSIIIRRSWWTPYRIYFSLLWMNGNTNGSKLKLLSWELLCRYVMVNFDAVCSVHYLFNEHQMPQPNVSPFIIYHVMLNADRKEDNLTYSLVLHAEVYM